MRLIPVDAEQLSYLMRGDVLTLEDGSVYRFQEYDGPGGLVIATNAATGEDEWVDVWTTTKIERI